MKITLHRLSEKQTFFSNNKRFIKIGVFFKKTVPVHTPSSTIIFKINKKNCR